MIDPYKKEYIMFFCVWVVAFNDVTSGTGSTYPSGAPKYTPDI